MGQRPQLNPKIRRHATALTSGVDVSSWQCAHGPPQPGPELYVENSTNGRYPILGRDVSRESGVRYMANSSVRKYFGAFIANQRRPKDDLELTFALLCPITGYPCEGDLSHLCEDYGCARKGGLSPHSHENF